MKEYPSDPDDYKIGFMAFLKSLRADEKMKELKDLRKNMGMDNIYNHKITDLLSDFIPRYMESVWKKNAFVLIASLFGLHPKEGGADNFGQTIRDIGKDPVIERRFTRLLECGPGDLPRQLTALVKCLKRKNVPVNWDRLLEDLLSWEREDRSVQYKWAAAFWKNRDREDAGGPDNFPAGS